MIIIWLILLLGVTRYIGLRGGRQIPMPPPHLKPTRKEEIVNYHLSMGEEISEVELNSILKNKTNDSKTIN
jgi:hypothetical protein